MSDSSKVVGCGFVLFQAFVTTPMWMVLLFMIMSQVGMPIWAWALYWCYVPAVAIGVIIGGIARTIMED